MRNHLVKTIILLLVITSFQWCWGQSEFLKQQQQVYGASKKCMVQLADSGYFVVGDYYPSNQEQTFKRLDKFGTILWYKRAVLSGDQHSVRAIATSCNKMVSASYTPAANTFAVLFMDSLGNSISHRKFSYSSTFYDSFRVDLAESPDKKVYALGSNQLVKMDSVGNVLWQKRIVVKNMNLMGVHPISSSKLILTGIGPNAQAINSDYDIVQICIDSSGTLLWSKSFGSLTKENPTSSLYANGKIYHIGSIDNYISGRKGSFIFCTDTTGTQLWCKWTDTKLSYIESAVLKDGSIACLLSNNSTFSILRFSDSGDFMSGTKLNSPLGFFVSSMATTNDGGVYLEAYSTATSNRYGIKLAGNLYPDCIPVLPYTPDSMFNQVLDEKPLLCGIYPYTVSSVVTPTWTNLPFVNVAVCSSTCNVVAILKPDKTHLCQGETVTFSSNSSNATTYQWWLGSTLVSTDSVFSHTFPIAGEYRMKLIASDSICSDSTFTRILVSDPLPQPVFTYETDHFKGWFNTAVPPFSSATWNFGDGTGMQMHIDSLVHNFKSQGTYQVCLTEVSVCGTVSNCQDVTLSIDSTFQFVKHYNETASNVGGRWAQGSHALYDGNLLLSGTDDTWGSAGWDGTLVKTDKKGKPLWTQIITQGTSSGVDIEITRIAETYKGYLLLGASNGVSPYLGIMDSSGLTTYMLRLTTNSQGALVSKPYEKSNGNIVFTGCYANQAFITETDLALGIYWFKRHTGIHTLYSTAKTPGGFLMAGTDLTNTQIGIMKVDNNGDYVYARSISHSGSTPTSALDIAATPDGNYIVTGSSNSILYLMKIDSNCNVLWTKKYSDSVSSLGFGKSVTVDKTGNISVVSSGGVVLKTDSTGNVVWAWNPPGASVFGAVRHAKTLDDGLIVAGTVGDYFGEEDLSLYRLDNSGNIPTCWGTPMSVAATPITAVVSVSTDAQTNGTPALTMVYSGNLYNSYEAEICASASPILNADFNYGNACSGTSIVFNDLSLGTVASHSWSFQGGTPATSTSINPSVTWNAPGSYVVTLTITGADGSTNTETRNITVTAVPSVNAGNDLTTCSGNPVLLEGSGTGTLSWNPSPSIYDPSDAVTSANPAADELFILNAVLGGCFGSDTMMVTVLPGFSSITTETICSGLSYLFQGQNYSASGTYSASYTGTNGCDSVYILDLTVTPPLSSIITEVICTGDTYAMGDSVFSATGNYTIPFQNQAGCDSTVLLNLTVISPDSTIDVQICAGGSYTVGDSTFYSSGIYTVDLLNQNGCDSTVTLNLIVFPQSASNIDATICSGENYLIGSNTFSTSGIHVVVLPNTNGCDSTVTLNLTVLPVDSSITNAAICAGESYSFNGTDYSAGGMYTATVSTALGCDSIAILNLTVYAVSSSILNETICSGESYFFNGNAYSLAGVYSDTLESVNGCDSTVVLNLTVTAPNTGVTMTGYTLAADQSGASYTWFNCGDQMIVGTGQSFTAIENGNYAVVVTLNNCSDTSACYSIIDLGVSNPLFAADWLVYPVPSGDLIYVLSPVEFEGEPYTLYDHAGRIVLTGLLESGKTIISLESYAVGVYQLKAGNATHVFKVIRQ